MFTEHIDLCKDNVSVKLNLIGWKWIWITHIATVSASILYIFHYYNSADLGIDSVSSDGLPLL